MPAAGSGSRFGSGVRKQYAPLEGRTVIEWALAPFLADRRCAQLVVALALSTPPTSGVSSIGSARTPWGGSSRRG